MTHRELKRKPDPPSGQARLMLLALAFPVAAFLISLVVPKDVRWIFHVSIGVWILFASFELVRKSIHQRRRKPLDYRWN